MKRYCKNIDITDYRQILPFVVKWYNGRRLSWQKRKMAKLAGEYGGLEGLAKEAVRRIKERDLKLKPIQFFERRDPSNGKLRVLGNESQMQQVFDYIATHALMPLFMAKIGFHQYASIPKRGQVLGAKTIQKWVRTDKAGTKYFDKLDIKKCFPSISRGLVRKLLARDVKNPDLLWLVEALLATYRAGLSIGSYLSQWLANYVLSYAYHFVQERCYKSRRGKRIKLAGHVLFYMDDILLTGSSRSGLKKVSRMLTAYLAGMGLSVKANHNVRALKDNSIDMMGFVIHASGRMTIRGKTFIRLRRILLRSPCLQRAKRFSAYYGFIKYSNSYRLILKYRLYNKFLVMRNIISRRDKNALQRRNKYFTGKLRTASR